ncbi:MAG: hypothetical protein RSA87_00620 [Malacoplasma sp.]
MNFNESKENKIFELKSKYKTLLNNLNSFSPFDRLSSIKLDNISSNDKIDLLIDENLHIQDNIEHLQKKISEKLDNFELKNNTINTNEDLKKIINFDHKNNLPIETPSSSEKSNFNNDDIDFLKKEVISLNNILLQINDGIYKKMDFSINELTSLYESLKIEIEKLSNKEFKIETPPLSAKDIGNEILESLSTNIKNELIFFKDNFDKKLDDLKSQLEFEPFIRENYYKLNNQNARNQENSNNETTEKNNKQNEPNTYCSNEINLNEEDLNQIFIDSDDVDSISDEIDIDQEENNIESINRNHLEKSSTPLKNNSEFASISSLEKKPINKDENIDINIDKKNSHQSTKTDKKNATDISLEIQDKWNLIVSNMEQNIQIITEENSFLKSKFDTLQKNYEILKNDYIQKNHEASNVEKILALTNHKFNELSKMLDQQDIMMRNLQEENKHFFTNFEHNKIEANEINELEQPHPFASNNSLISSDLKRLEEKLINIQYELSRIDNDNFHELISEYKDKVI